jgi:cell division protein FtsL
LVKRFLQRLHLGLVLGIITTLYIGYYLVVTVKHNYDLQKQISSLQQQIDDLKLERQQLQYKIQYYQTDSYKEKEARAKLGLQAPGEGVVILPQKDEPSTPQDTKPKAKPKSNPQQWLDFLSGKADK